MQGKAGVDAVARNDLDGSRCTNTIGDGHMRSHAEHFRSDWLERKPHIHALGHLEAVRKPQTLSCKNLQPKDVLKLRTPRARKKKPYKPNPLKSYEIQIRPPKKTGNPTSAYGLDPEEVENASEGLP